MTKTFTIVENAGYEREQDVTRFATLHDALRHLNRTYSAEERDSEHAESLHIDVRMDWTDAEGEHSEYIL